MTTTTSYPPSSQFEPSSSTSNLRELLDAEEEQDVFDPSSIDPALRLRTVRTAHSVLAESIRSEAMADQRKRKRRLFSGIKRKASTMGSKKRPVSEIPSTRSVSGKSSKERSSTINDFGTSTSTTPLNPIKEESNHTKTNVINSLKERKHKIPQRRTVYVNLPLPQHLVNSIGDPIIRYVRNKVRTSKYTIVTFLPKNLFEQFRRVANIYFLTLVILQLFSIFGAPNAQIGMLPLIFILSITAIKDGIEDWRRSRLDDEVNNSATTKLGGWRNVNQPRDPRSFLERILGIGTAPGKASKGVRKLRDTEAKAGQQIIMDQIKNIDEEEELSNVTVMDKGTIPLDNITPSQISLSSNMTDPPDYSLGRLIKTQSVPSMMSRRSGGVIDWSFPGSGSAQWERTLWKKLEVGDLVLLRDNEQVPADIIVLSTSNPDDLCFVETKNLDGETNLKVRKALKATARINSEEDLEHARFIIESEPPHANLYNYNGVLRYTPVNEGKEGGVRSEAVTINEMLLRGCSLRNTKWIIGMVIFTGADTKIMLNGGETPSKRSKIEKETSGYYASFDQSSAKYYEIGAEPSDNIYLDALVIFFSCLIVFQNIVPISLYITIEVVKTIQAYFIYQDVDMYYAAYDTPCVPKTWNISDDLGQIEYVFSDKTGTLTQNIMEFKKCSIRGITFGEGMTEAMLGAAKRTGENITEAMEDQEPMLTAAKEKMVRIMKSSIHNRYLREDKLTLISPDMASSLSNPSDPLRPHLIAFWRALAICHTVLSDAPDPDKPTIIDYKAESPDEAALVGAARDVGFPFVNRNPNRIDIEVLGHIEKWTPLRVLEFNSSRKRMSVIVRDPQNRIVLFTKGADSVIFQRLAADHDERLKSETLRDLETFANGGLRTLLVAQRYLDENEFNEWAETYDTACASVEDRDSEIDKACELIEHSLTILGATALEDKLQEGVPDAIATLHQAGIKLWILTGDKLQTAIEIGYSCNLLTNDMEVMIISADSEPGARMQIEAGLNKIASMIPPLSANPSHISKNRNRQKMDLTGNFAVVIDGDSLRFALHESLKKLFLELCKQCAAVICCRVSPSQKALTVRLVKEGCKAMTLSIGDGANDVAMIQEANIGVGLFGLEGSQAAMSADYAFGQFRFLTKLLLVHGRWSYVRIADMHANFFYKNIIWTLAMFWYQLFCGFDGTYVFDYTILLLYNTVFTSLPVGIMGAFDQDTNAIASLAFPQLYKRGIQSLEYTRTRFWLYMLDGLYQSAVIFFLPYLVTYTGISYSSSGRDTLSLSSLGATISACGVLAANMYVGINTRYWTIIMFIVYIGSTLLLYIFLPIYSVITDIPFAGTVEIVYSTFTFWATVIFTVFVAVGPRWLIRSIRQSYYPLDKDIVREAWIKGDLKRQLGLKRRRDKNRPETKTKTKIDSNTNTNTIIGTVLKRTFSGDSPRGSYQPANLSSPQRDYPPRSPLFSGSERNPFSYPPSPSNPNFNSQTSPTYHNQSNPLENDNHTTNDSFHLSQPTVPPPFSKEEQTPITTDGLRPVETPLSQISYTSPSAIDTFNLASAEIDRMSRNSMDLQRMSSSMMEIERSQSPQKHLSPSARSSLGFDSTSVRRRSVPLSGGLSPVRGSFDDRHLKSSEGDVFSAKEEEDGYMGMAV
ncbi:hypothetical protein TREMEDRAFT_26850 [Tremella mesenterica DSM 1558]|uniref:uncharacterized protein n=1 Tax=Tremella mesenterica (strain ATCC 24925 / CBS 8224 / DSM 1558 / NBRC 9311 / NRRL Y-6157 / RJB 2259-6 / UBC 559-6) TaxID=578456 RepID=UPI0003F49D82|nr:uncharacterized protein TREMEDRAFT_26850 [Tremella mesenterica DSM 1558]EIW73502.1 hypothetical protein TREMEDRAFT_26850 [Tremella mesenterica DSM 1558]